MNDFSSRIMMGGDLGGTGARNAAGKLSAVAIADSNDVTRTKMTVTADDPGREQAFAEFPQSLASAVVHEDRTFWMVEESDPAFSTFKLVRLGDEKGALFLT